MRGDRVGVGDICEVSCDDWTSGDTPSGDDGRGDRGKRDTGMVGRLGVIEFDVPWEPSRDRISVNDGTWVEHGVCGVHWTSKGGALWVRGNRVGVGDICEVSDGRWRSGHT